MAEASSTISSDVKLKRFLYTSSEQPHFKTGSTNNLYHHSNVTCISEYLASSNPEKLFNIIEIVHSEGLLPRREAIFFLLALAIATVKCEALKHRAYRTLSTLIKDSRDLCLFIKHYTKLHMRFSSAINKLIASYYSKKEPLELLKEITENNGFYSWTHKDLLKLSHFKWDGLATAVITVYILFGMKKAEVVADDNHSVSNILSHLKKIEDLKRCEDENRIAELIPELHCSIERVPSFYHNSKVVWNALLPELSYRDIINYLRKWYTLGFLKLNSEFLNRVVEYLTNSDKIQNSKIHPVEVFIGLKDFEKGGKPINPKFKKYITILSKENPEKAIRQNKVIEATKSPSIISALNKALQISLCNLQPWGRKIMITIDVTEKMELPCLHNTNLTCAEVAAILTFSILKVERDVTIALFINNKINIINIDKNASFSQTLRRIYQNGQPQSSYCTPSAPLEWATKKRKPVDLFINLLYYHHWLLLIPQELRANEKPLESLNTYRAKMTLPHAKLVSFSLGSSSARIADGSPNVLDISGFDKTVPLALEAFSKGLF